MPSEINFKALVRVLRAHGITVGHESARLSEQGQPEEASSLLQASSDLDELSNRLEPWRLHQADTLRRLALAVATQRAALDDFEMKDAPDMRPREKVAFHRAANITQGVAQDLEALAQQLDELQGEGERD